jgi:tetratricopeptide (TPR) repeat protein
MERVEGAMAGDARVPAYLGRVLAEDDAPVGTCFQVTPEVLVTAWHVVTDAGAAKKGETVRVDGLPSGGAPPESATVVAFDAVHDLAVLWRAAALPGSESRLVPTDGELVGTDMVVTGHCVVDDPARGTSTRYLDAPGAWAGGAMREDAIALGRLSSKDLLRGMSGAPVRRRSDGAVVGVVSARYNSADGWLRDSVWVARTEDLRSLLADLPGTDQLVAALDLPLSGAADLVLAARSTHPRGILAQGRGDLVEAERLYRASLEIEERLGDQAGVSASYHQLGVLAQGRGDPVEAERLYRLSLEIDEWLRDQVGISASYHQLGMLAQGRGELVEAERLYRQSLDIDERLGDQAGVAVSWSQLGSLRAEEGKLSEAVILHVRALALRLALEVPAASVDVRALVDLRTRLGSEAFIGAIRQVLDESSLQNLLTHLDEGA